MATSYEDEPLDPIVQDNINVDCVIGGREYYVTELEVHLTNGSESNYAVGKVHQKGSNNKKPSTGDPLNGEKPEKILINVDNELMEKRPDANGEIKRIFTGVISNASRIEHELYEFMAFWPGFNQIQNGSIDIQPATANTVIETVPWAKEKVRAVDYAGRWHFTSFVAKEIGEYVTSSDGRFTYNIHLREGGWNINGEPAGYDVKMNTSGESQPLVASGGDEGLLERVVNATNSVWRVDRYGIFHIGPPIPDGDIGTAIRSHKLRYITDTTAGKKSPAWRSIVVIGDGVVSQDGWNSSAQVNDSLRQMKENVTQSGGNAAVSSNLAQPTFEYTNLEIDTETEARNVLNKIKDKIQTQMAEGEITVVGHPEVWPGDAIELPDAENQPFGLERYGVRKVIHRVNSSDGFITKIQVMGQTNANKTFWASEADLDKAYPPQYKPSELKKLPENAQLRPGPGGGLQR